MEKFLIGSERYDIIDSDSGTRFNYLTDKLEELFKIVRKQNEILESLKHHSHLPDGRMVTILFKTDC